MSPGFYRLMGAQGLAGLADNALLLVVIAMLIEQSKAAHWIPLLKLGFNLSYVVLGPWVGRLADAWHKPRVMQWANGLKLMAVLSILLGLDVMLAYVWVGLGAAIYSPAKYGWITEVEPPHRLVQANAWIEVSTVSAAVLGVALGGLLISDAWTSSPLALAINAMAWWDSRLGVSVMLIFGLYVAVALMQRGIPHSGVPCLTRGWQLGQVWRDFWVDQKILWTDRLGQVSLAVTTLFWGVGATMQLLVLLWCQQVLGLGLDQGAYLQACTAVGVVVGAWLAGRWVPLHLATRVLGLGVVLGLLLPTMNLVHSWPFALGVMLLVGVISGLFVVPMNALLQHRGVNLLSAGRSIAVQNVNENASIVTMMGVYSGLLYLQCPFETITWILGGFIATCMALVCGLHASRRLAASV
ncbi:MAG: lysophospholipid transporter LplT [Betaproteobacteria bacterium]|nr:lysophospholipid transporter LplT [Betaproteobacteria bacterium]